MRYESIVADIVGPLVDPHGPGCAVAVVRDGRPGANVAFGLANLEHRAPVTPDTIFHVASVSKQFAAHAVAQLASEGLLDLDAPVAEVLKWLPFSAVTTRQLVHHTSGVRDQWELFAISGRTLEDVITTRHITELLKRQRELNFAPGSDQSYSNAGYTLLALIVEAVTGQTLREWGDRHVFAPLGMSRTRWLDDHHDVVAGRADSYAPGREGAWTRVALSYSTVGATSLHTTASDLTVWAEYLMSEGRHLWAETAALNDGTRTRYAFGLSVREHNGRAIVGHSGGDAAFRSQLDTVPAERLAVAMCCNTGKLDPGALSERIIDAILGDGTPTGPAGSWTPAPADLQRLAGLYVHREAGTTHRLKYADGRLVLHYETGDIPLRPSEPSVLTSGRSGMRLRIDGDTVVSESPLSTRGRWERAAPPVRPDTSGVTGMWWSDELESAFRIHEADGGLFVSSPAWPRLPLTPTIADWFRVTLPAGPFPMPADIAYDRDADELFLTTARTRRLRHRRLAEAPVEMARPL